MQERILVVVGAFLFITAGLIGCSQGPKAATSQEAIQNSKSMASVEEQAKYLVSQANSFINSQKFDQAIETAKYVLANLDQNSVDAKKIIEDATAQMKKAAEGAVDEMKKKLEGFGK